MSFEWPLVRLGDYVDSCLGKMLDAKKNKGIPQPYLGNSNVRWGAFELTDLAEMKFEPHEEERYGLLPGDLVVCEGGEPGRCAIWTGAAGMKVQKALHRIRTKPQLNNYFLYYWFCYAARNEALEAYFTGTTIKHLTGKAIAELKVPLPPLSVQEGITDILKCLDDRITLLRASNATLEAIAQALFKSWFVDFDPVHAKQQGRAPEGMNAQTAALFPDSFEESELGMVPKGWRVSQLKDCCTKVESGGTPKRTVEEYWNGNIGWLTSGEVRNPIVFDTKEKITQLGVAESSAKVWPTGTTVVAMYGATAGEVCLLDSALSANQACCGLIPKENFRAFLYFCTRRESENLASKSSGSAQQNLNKALVSGHQILMPSESVIQRYEELAGNLLNKWIEGERLADTLGKTRDTLLPRLISGQLRLPEAQALAEEAVDA